VNSESCSRAFEELLRLTELLRSPDGCAWDRAQTIETLRPHLVEEFHEVLEALDHGDDGKVRDELGDLMFLIVFMARIAEEEGRFDLEEIIGGIDAKLRRRHPHVFGEERAETPDEVRSRWESSKLGEVGHSARRSILDGLPPDLSALLTARRMQEKAAAVGFDWKDIADVLGKAEEELVELRDEIAGARPEGVEGELGDLLFSIVNVARFLRIDPEAALRKTNLKFRKRFALVEERFRGRELRDVGLEAMDRVWEEAKDLEEEG
jgi:tetrapyrrole methylase family protein/MazG family protein